MTDFGDFDEDDAYDPNEPADPEQVAIKLHDLRRDRAFESQRWEQLSESQRAVRIVIVFELLKWLRRSGANMSIYYTEMLEVLKAAGCVVAENSTTNGWQTRARSSGGFPAPPLAVFWHHTASTSTPANDLSYMCHSDDAPIGNLYIDRTGVCWPIAAGASNCAGKGGPVTFSRGTIPIDGGNTRGWQLEVANSGVGERWPVAQIDAFFRASNALNAHVGNQPYDITTHALGAGDGYTDRKIDPATADAVEGPWQPNPANNSGTWLLGDIRSECVLRSARQPPPDQEDEPMYLATLSNGDVVLVGSTVRPASGEELTGPYADLPRYTPPPASYWHDWLRHGADEYSRRVMG